MPDFLIWIAFNFVLGLAPLAVPAAPPRGGFTEPPRGGFTEPPPAQAWNLRLPQA